MNPLFYIFLIIIPFTSLNFVNHKTDYDYLLSWAKNNSLTISDKIKMHYLSPDNKTFQVNKNIFENEILLSIPSKLFLNIDKACKLFGKNTQNLYKKYRLKYTNFNDFSAEQSFISYLIYLTQQNVKNREKKFYQYYKYLFDTYETNLDSFPLFYNTEQSYLLIHSILKTITDYFRAVYYNELNILNTLKPNKKKIIEDDYLFYRTLIGSKSHNISGHCEIIPFIDMFDVQPKKYNIEFRIDEKKNVVIFATKNINIGEKLYLRCNKINNLNGLVVFGKTFEDMNDYIDSFKINIVSDLFLNKKKLSKYFDKNLDEKTEILLDKIELMNKKFYEKCENTYRIFAKMLEIEDTKENIYGLFLENLELILNTNDKVTTSHIYKVFYKKEDVDNIIRIFKIQKNVLTQKIKELKLVIENLKKNKRSNDL